MGSVGNKVAPTITNGDVQRDQILDLLKGIGIILMIARHARAPYSDFVLLFHMAVFFVASGYLYDIKYAKTTESLARYVVKKIKGLYLPYLFYTIVFVVLNNLFLRVHVYTDNPDFLASKGIETTYATLGTHYSFVDMLKKIVNASLFRAGTQVGGALWFFQTLFIVLISYTVFEYLIRKFFCKEEVIISVQTLTSIILLLLGYYFHVENISMYGLNRVCSVYCLIHIGRVMKQYKVMAKLLKMGGATATVWIIAALSVLFFGYHRGYISIDGNNIETPFCIYRS